MNTTIKLKTEQLNRLLKSQREGRAQGDVVDVVECQFYQQKGAEEIAQLQALLPSFELAQTTDSAVEENRNFSYNIVVPKGEVVAQRAIVLLHGLNERSWSKYLSWAELLATSTRTPVILFPIAFHMNRTPMSWHNPRHTSQWLSQQDARGNRVENSTFANVTLSSRISESPLRFYASGKETCYNLWQLIEEIDSGTHPHFAAGTTVNLFGYSIGAMISQVMMMANPDGLLSQSRLFIFMGGSIFSKMEGSARDIMDQNTLRVLRKFYLTNFVDERGLHFKPTDDIDRAFMMLMEHDVMKHEREEAFAKLRDRIFAITMKKDVVMTTEGAQEAFGLDNSTTMLEEYDFPFDYSHQIPFPTNSHTPSELVSMAFEVIFSKASIFYMRPAKAI